MIKEDRYRVEFCPDDEAETPSPYEWVIFDYVKNESLHNEWFETEKQAQDYLNEFLQEIV